MNIRIGLGYDVHRLEKGHKFILGGMEIIHSKGIVAHSDGDVLIHSICDALLGALSLRDIGYHFPDNNNDYKNIDSKILLKKTNELLKNKGFEIINIDNTICLEKPKIQEYIVDMQKILANILNIKIDQLSIKATTTERLGFIGREEGIAVQSVALVKILNK